MIGIAGLRARTRLATRWVKSGLSMITRISADASVTASAVCRMRRRIAGNRFAIAASPMIDSSSIGNSDDSPSLHHRPAADAVEPHRAAKALAQHLHQAGAEPIAGFLGRDQEDVSRDVRRCPRRRHAGRPVTKRPLASAASIMACGIGDHGVAGDDRNPGQLGRSGALDGPRSHGRQIEPQVLPALGRLDQHATRRRGANPAFGAQPRHPRQQPVGALDILHPDHMAVDDDGRLTDVEAAERKQHVAPPRDIGQCMHRPERLGSDIPRASGDPGRRP